MTRSVTHFNMQAKVGKSTGQYSTSVAFLIDDRKHALLRRFLVNELSSRRIEQPATYLRDKSHRWNAA